MRASHIRPIVWCSSPGVADLCVAACAHSLLNCIIVDWDARKMNDKHARIPVYVPKSLLHILRMHMPCSKELTAREWRRPTLDRTSYTHLRPAAHICCESRAPASQIARSRYSLT